MTVASQTAAVVKAAGEHIEVMEGEVNRLKALVLEHEQTIISLRLEVEQLRNELNATSQRSAYYQSRCTAVHTKLQVAATIILDASRDDSTVPYAPGPKEMRALEEDLLRANQSLAEHRSRRAAANGPHLGPPPAPGEDPLPPPSFLMKGPQIPNALE
jgi:chromosome segregation ATPase